MDSVTLSSNGAFWWDGCPLSVARQTILHEATGHRYMEFCSYITANIVFLSLGIGEGDSPLDAFSYLLDGSLSGISIETMSKERHCS